MGTNRTCAVLSSFLFTLLLGLGASPAFGQTATIRGTVTDTETGEGLVGANITVESAREEELPSGAASGFGGAFEVRGLSAGTYTVTVSYVGYTKEVIADVELSDGEVKTLNVTLSTTGILFNPISVTASRRPEKLLDAPASITVLGTREIEARPTLSVTDHLASVPGVDVSYTGLNSSNVVVRGFNNIFSTALLTLTDNRIARVPSLRLNAYQFISTTNDDIERIEVVLGPASALYGPNSANGVMHILTKSPFGSEGTTLSIAGGERSLFIGSFRHAGSFNNRFGYKISGEYYQGNDWEVFDPAEPDSIIKGRQTTEGRETIGGLVSNKRDFDVEKLAAEARLDYRFSDDFTGILSGGINRASNIELTGIGAGQAVDWKYFYVQGRIIYKDLFVQAFVNSSDAGETFILRTGDFIVDNSKLFVGQIQHSLSLGERQTFTYGVDALLTRPDTKNTINGRNEDDDEINEFGAYVQSETELSSKLKFVAAGRIDDHNRVKDPVFSPRAALVYRPDPAHNFRVTYNRAFTTPSTLNLFLDILSSSVLTADLAPALVPVIGPTIFDVRARGTPLEGFTFNIIDGRPQMVSLYGAALAAAGAIPSPNTYLPPDVNSVWPIIRGLAIAGADPALQPTLNAVLPQQLSTTVPGSFGTLNIVTESFDPVDPSSVRDLARNEPTIYNTFEVGYKGLIRDKFLVTIDVYHSEINDFVGPLIDETPNVFIDPDTFVPALVQDMVATGLIDQASATLIATGIAQQFAPLPIGLVSPREIQNATDKILTYRNFGDISLDGVDFSFSYYVNENWSFGGNYSYASENLFPKSATQPHDITLNAPRNKIGANVQYRNSDVGLDTQLRLRYVDSFPVNSGVFLGRVDSYTVLDLTAGYVLPFSSNSRLTLSVQNLFDEKHIEFVGAPEIGRLAIVRLTQSF